MKLTSIMAKASGLNWYKTGISIVLFVAWTGGVYMYSHYRCQLKHEQQKTEQAEEHTRVVVKEVQTRVPVVQTREVESAKQREKIKLIKEQLDEALKNRPENAGCDLSDDEFNSVSALAAKTHTAK